MAYEKMPCLYDTVKDLQDRLEQTIVRYNQIPVIVNVAAKDKLVLTDIVTKEKLYEVKPSDPNLDISSAEIGYLNWKPQINLVKYYNSAWAKEPNKVAYFERQPRRAYRQGLYADVVSSFHIDGKDGIGSENLFGTDGFRASIVGEFPSLEMAIELMDHENWSEIAISQSIALQKIESGLTLVYFRTKNVGWIVPRTAQISVNEGKYAWAIKRLFEHDGLEVVN